MHLNFLSRVTFHENCLCLCEKVPLVFINVSLLKVFCLRQPQKTETLFGNNNRNERDDNRVRVSPQRETFTLSTKYFIFFSGSSLFLTMRQIIPRRSVSMLIAYMAYL